MASSFETTNSSNLPETVTPKQEEVTEQLPRIDNNTPGLRGVEQIKSQHIVEDQRAVNTIREQLGLATKPAEGHEVQLPPEELELRQKRGEFLSRLRQDIDTVTDRLGKPIESGIKEPVVMLNAFELRTSQSCEGHLDKWSYGAPWIEIGPELPANWEELRDNKELRESLSIESKVMRTKAVSFLREFYKGRSVDYDVMLHPDRMGYGFRIQPVGLEEFNSLPDEERERLLPIYQQEMNDFAAFLQEKFLQEGEMPDVSEANELSAEIEAGHNKEDDIWEGYVDPRDTLMQKVKSFEISGNPIQDAIRIDEIDNKGRLRDALESGRMDALRSLVILRQEYRQKITEYANLDTAGLPRDPKGRTMGTVGYWQEVAPQVLELIDKILDDYGVTAQTMQEYDYQEAGKEGSRLVNMLIDLEDFRPSGDIRKDTIKFATIIKRPWHEENLNKGMHPVHQLLLTRENNIRAMEEGAQSHHLAETKRLIEEAMPVQNEVIDNILKYYQIKARDTQAWEDEAKL